MKRSPAVAAPFSSGFLRDEYAKHGAQNVVATRVHPQPHVHTHTVIHTIASCGAPAGLSDQQGRADLASGRDATPSGRGATLSAFVGVSTEGAYCKGPHNPHVSVPSFIKRPKHLSCHVWPSLLSIEHWRCAQSAEKAVAKADAARS